MNQPQEQNIWGQLSQVLLRSFIMGIIVLLVWFLLIIFANEWVYSIHSYFFPMREGVFSIIHYSGMALLKLFVFIFFLIPYIAIRWSGLDK